jgi:hypothetical protein
MSNGNEPLREIFMRPTFSIDYVRQFATRKRHEFGAAE